MEPNQAIQILAQVQLKFVGSGQDHQLLTEAIKTLAALVEHPGDAEKPEN
jgi:hypothetical protein